MIHEIITHPNVEPDFELVEELARIDLTKDIVICYNPLNVNDGKEFKKLVTYNVDEFILHTHEQYMCQSIHSNLIYNTFPRVKMILPNGLFPSFECVIPGLKIRNTLFDKIEGIELNQQLEIDDLQIDVTAAKGSYAFYDNIKISYQTYDHALFARNKFKGNYIPTETGLCSLRLIPHFIGMNLNEFKLNNIYVICSKYIHSRLPNF